MKRITGAALMAVMGICGCVSGPETGGGPPINYGRGHAPPTVPGMIGPGGAPVSMCGPYDQAPPAGAYQAQMMLRNSVPLSAVQMNQGGGMGSFGPAGAGPPPTMMPRGGMMSPIGIPFAPGVSPGPNVPSGPGMPGGPGMPPGGPGLNPAAFMQGGMNPGVVTANMPPGGMPRGGVAPAAYAQGKVGFPFTIGRTQVKFTRPTGMRISWYTQGPDGKPMWSTTPIETPGRYNFTQAAIYRLKLTGIEGRPGLELYPTLEVVPGNPNTEAFLAHSSVPVEFTNDDFKQVAEGNYIVKVIYLPYPQFQDAAGTGTDEILSTRLEPGADPIEEARRRGSILLVIRMGNVDQEAPNTPPLNAPVPGAGQPNPMLMPPGMGRPNLQVPMYGMPGPHVPNMPMLPPANMKDPGKASTGTPGAPINVPSVPLPGAGGPGAVDTNTAPPLPLVPPELNGKKNVPSAPTPPVSKGNGPALPPLPGEPAAKDTGKSTPDLAPKGPMPPAGKTGSDLSLPALPTPPASGAPMLPAIPPLPDPVPGPQSRQDEGTAPTVAQLAGQVAAPRR